MLRPRLDEPLHPELDGARRGVAWRARAQVLQRLVEEHAYRFGRGRAGKGLVDGVTPELHAHLPDGRVGNELGKADEFEVEAAEGEVGVCCARRDEAAYYMRIIVAVPFGKSASFGTVKFHLMILGMGCCVLELRLAVFPRLDDVCVCDDAPGAPWRGLDEPSQAMAGDPCCSIHSGKNAGVMRHVGAASEIREMQLDKELWGLTFLPLQLL